MKKIIKFAGHEFELYPAGVLYLKEYRVMIVSDLHLEKAESIDHIHPLSAAHNTRDILMRLSKCAEELKPEKIILLGDIFHDRNSFGRISLDNMDLLYSFLKNYEIVWVEGKHPTDFTPPDVDMRMEYAYLNLNFRHIASDNEDFEISGHYHPAVTIHVNDHKDEHRRCFVRDKTKLILPSFGSSGDEGMDVSDPAIQTLFQSEMKIYPIGKSKVYKLKSAV